MPRTAFKPSVDNQHGYCDEVCEHCRPKPLLCPEEILQAPAAEIALEQEAGKGGGGQLVLGMHIPEGDNAKAEQIGRHGNEEADGRHVLHR
eukprot:CAMPEP_0181402604 /NCGR_PEP_ID=MMETSP1110-20121109/3261_1 /TAXON_ID=174948 /ORGANISM="Symbiodinium sp., Strain CCMP421" /LENGTH=90 /DNA_ID=CAMNT_0023524829 /DNA_START=214 /DNA_END=486 /DNA_ORIENTATION=-